MSAAVKLRQFLGGSESLALAPGQDGLELLIPGSETLSAGLCPVAPSMTLAVDLGEPIAMVRVRSGQTKTQRVATKRRGEVELRWTVPEADRNALLAFFRDEVGQHLRPFFADLDIDGSLSRLRPLSPPQFSWDTMAGHTITVRCEEIF